MPDEIILKIIKMAVNVNTSHDHLNVGLSSDFRNPDVNAAEENSYLPYNVSHDYLYVMAKINSIFNRIAKDSYLWQGNQSSLYLPRDP